MQVNKPKKLGILTRPFEWGGNCYFTVTALAFFEFDRPGDLLSDTAMWPFIVERFGDEGLFDMGMPKPRAETIVIGDAKSPGGRPVRGMDLRLRIGPVEKTLRVFGRRFWKRLEDGRDDYVITEPQPFDTMPLDFAAAYGGEDFPENPNGLGFNARARLDAGEAVELARIERPDRPLLSPGDRGEPLGFGPIDFALPQRIGKTGTYDADWLKHRFPGWADDLDRSAFNAAAEDQWMPEHFQGEERFELHGFHPDGAVTGALPGIRARAFLSLSSESEPSLREIGLRADSLWLFPLFGKGIVAFRGTRRIGDPDGEDVTSVMIAAERLADPPRDGTYYANIHALRMDPETKINHVFKDSELLPPEDPTVLAAREEERERYTEEHLAEQHERMQFMVESAFEKVGMTPPAGIAVPPPDPPPFPLPLPSEIASGEVDFGALFEGARKLEAMAEEKRDEVMKLAEAQKAEAEALLAELDDGTAGAEADPEIIEAQKRMIADKALGDGPADGLDEIFGIDIPEAGSEESAPPEPVSLDGPVPENPGVDIEAFLSSLSDGTEPVPEGAGSIPEDAREKTRDALREARRAAPEAIAPEEPLLPGVAAYLGALIVDGLAAGRHFDHRDLAGADLRGADLKGADLTGTLLEQADLSGADLSGIRGEKLVLTGADLTGARLDGAHLKDANLSQAKLAGASLSGVYLEGATLIDIDLSEVNLAGATLRKVILINPKLERAHLDIAKAEECIVINGAIDGASLAYASLTRCLFIDCSMLGSDWLGARLAETLIANPKLAGSRFSGAKVRATFVGEGDMTKLLAMQSRFDGAGLRQMNLEGSSFAGARFTEADLGHANFQTSDLRGASLGKSMLASAKFGKSLMTGANLFQALARKADFSDADLSGANLYGADLLKSDFEAARLDGAIVDKTVLEERGAGGGGR